MSPANLSVLVGRDVACIKVTGRANFACSPDFKTVLNELAQKGFDHFIIDLRECVLMDSTFLGVLAGFAMKLTPNGAPASRGVELSNPTSRVTELLENLGAAHLFNLTSGPLQLPQEVTQNASESTQVTREQIARTSLEAHEVLMAMSQENQTRFKDVAKFLAEDLKNLTKPA